MITTDRDCESLIADAVNSKDLRALRRCYEAQDEFLVLDDFLHADVLKIWDRELESLKPRIHRNFIPKHKKGGSVGYDSVRVLAPTIDAIYQSPALLGLLSEITGATVQPCPASDLHRCALYSYTEEGDHIGWHDDTSYYKDRRWTLLVGFQNQSSSRLLCKLHTRNAGHEVEDLSVQVGRGTLVLFNGDKVYHCVTPTKAGEFRYIVTMQYVVDGLMNPFMRFVSHMKDSIAYFGLKEVFWGRRLRVGQAQTTPAQ